MFFKFSRAAQGVGVPHSKKTHMSQTGIMPVPNLIYVSVQQHIGAAAIPVVSKGEKVFVGSLLCKSGGIVSSNIHSGVSGTVKEFITLQFVGGKADCIVIETDKEQTVSPDIKPPVVNDYKSFVAAIEQSGLVGLGGAGFPTNIKLSPKDLSSIDTLIINAAECEPFITADNREMTERPDCVMAGAMFVKRYLNLKRVIVAVERNKPEALDLMFSLAAGDKNIEVFPLETRYPQGAEKVLIETVTGREVPEGGLPAGVGVIVLNVATVSFIARYLETGMPLVTKRITVDGDIVKTPQNVEVIIGTTVKDIIDFCGGFTAEPGKVLLGGPMMGTSVPNLSLPIQKQTNAIIAISQKAAFPQKQTPCIHCARCVRDCPVGLSPVEITREYEMSNQAELKKLKVSSCIECGCCSFTCPAKRPLTPTMKLAKAVLQRS